MKEIIIWNDKYLTGIEIIDSQHKNIFKCVNNLFDAIEKLEIKEELLEKIRCIDFYTTEHFDTEEKYMLELNYPGYLEHKKTHEEFKKVYEEIRYNYVYKKDDEPKIIEILRNKLLDRKISESTLEKKERGI